MQIKTLCHDDVLRILPTRNANTHKGDYGKLLLLCGSRGYTGAAALSAMGALRAGAGLVYLCVPESIYEIEAAKLLEPVIYPLPDCDGKLDCGAIQIISELLPKIDTVLIGPGLGQSDGTFSVLEYVLNQFCGPVIVDADGINMIAEHKDILRGRTTPTILTPHEGEFVRLQHSPICGERLQCALEAGKDLGCIVVLKGNETIVTDGEVAYINATGNPGMAVGGSGDVLAGMITGLVGQGIPVLEAVACAVWIHGAAGDICAQEIGQYGMLPSDMLQVLPRLMK